MRLQLASGDTLHLPDSRARRILRWLLEKWPDPFPVTVRDGLVRFHFDGQAYSLRPNYGDFLVFTEIMYCDAYGIHLLPTPVGTVVDLGANIGMFSLRAASVAERVVAVEPVASNLEMAERILTEGDVREKVSLHKAAVCGQSGGMIRVFSSNCFPAGNSVFQRHTSRWGQDHYEDVPRLSIVDLFAREQIGRCSLLKCDIEGAEFDAFESLPLSLLHRIDRIVMEVHLCLDAHSVHRFANLRGRLQSAGFHVEHTPTRRWWGGQRRSVNLTAVNRLAQTRANQEIIAFRRESATSPRRVAATDPRKAA
jgi:FkbM family methyltransferase